MLKKKHRSLTASRLLYWMLSMTIFIDFLNGLFSSLGIGTIYRFALTVLCLMIIIRYSAKLSKMVFFMLLFLGMNTLISAIRHGSVAGVTYDLKMMMRVMTSINIIFAVCALYNNGYFTSEMVQKVIENNLWYTPMLFIITRILNIGHVSYEYNQVGFKSVFLSLNSINIALILLYTYSVFKIFNSKHPWYWGAATVYVAIPMLMLGTKTSIAIILMLPLLCTFLYLHTRKGRRVFLALVGVAAVASFFLLESVLKALEGVLARQSFLFQNRDLISYIFSGRNWMLEMATDYYLKMSSPLEYLFGQGYYYSHNQLATLSSYLQTAEVRPIEMDWADLLLAYGPLSLLFTYGYGIGLLYRCRKKWRNRFVQPYYISTLILLAFSALAGHVYTEAISSTFLAFAMCGMSLNEMDLENETRRCGR